MSFFCFLFSEGAISLCLRVWKVSAVFASEVFFWCHLVMSYIKFVQKFLLFCFRSYVKRNNSFLFSQGAILFCLSMKVLHCCFA